MYRIQIRPSGRQMLALLLITLSHTGLAQPVPAEVPDAGWMIRLRTSWLRPTNTNEPDLPLARVEINDRTYAQLGVGRQFTSRIGAEFIISYPQQHDVRLRGQKMGTVEQLPATLIAQYHFLPDRRMDPYAGLGINYTRFSSVTLPDTARIANRSTGLAIQLGIDYRFSRHLSLNVDWKRVRIETEIEAGGSKLTQLKIDPDVFSVGMGYRF